MNTYESEPPINSKLPQIEDKVPNKNLLKSYVPIRTQGNDFNWASVIRIVLSALLGKKLNNYSYETYKQDCQTSFMSKIDEEEFWKTIENMYFADNRILSISPEFSLLKNDDEENKQANIRMASLFINMLGNYRIEKVEINLNFIEQELLNVLNEKINISKSFAEDVNEYPYIPYLAKCFRDDLKFLASHPKYMLQQIEAFLGFYAFTYIAQLSLALPDWISGEEPVAKPLYFIMDHEKASSERTHIRKHGYKLFKDFSYKIFPMLSLLEILQPNPKVLKIPLWKLSANIKNSSYPNLELLMKRFAIAFRAKRNLEMTLPEGELDAIGWLEYALKLSEEQFKDTTTERPDIIRRYVNDLEKKIASEFTQLRGRAGRVLILNQDRIILLTNIVIGNNSKVRFQELLIGFQQRGVFVDRQTEQELIKFYERIGNVERMSDSGDAVYVRKTI